MGDTAFQYVPLLRWIRRRGWHFVIRQQGRIKVYHIHHGWRKINTFSWPKTKPVPSVGFE